MPYSSIPLEDQYLETIFSAKRKGNSLLSSQIVWDSPPPLFFAFPWPNSLTQIPPPANKRRFLVPLLLALKQSPSQQWASHAKIGRERIKIIFLSCRHFYPCFSLSEESVEETESRVMIHLSFLLLPKWRDTVCFERWGERRSPVRGQKIVAQIDM